MAVTVYSMQAVVTNVMIVAVMKEQKRHDVMVTPAGLLASIV